MISVILPQTIHLCTLCQKYHQLYKTNSVERCHQPRWHKLQYKTALFFVSEQLLLSNASLHLLSKNITVLFFDTMEEDNYVKDKVYMYPTQCSGRQSLSPLYGVCSIIAYDIVAHFMIAYSHC